MAAVKNARWGIGVMQLLLDRLAEIKITRRIVKGAAENPGFSTEMLIDRTGNGRRGRPLSMSGNN